MAKVNKRANKVLIPLLIFGKITEKAMKSWIPEKVKSNFNTALKGTLNFSFTSY